MLDSDLISDTNFTVRPVPGLLKAGNPEVHAESELHQPGIGQHELLFSSDVA